MPPSKQSAHNTPLSTTMPPSMDHKYSPISISSLKYYNSHPSTSQIHTIHTLDCSTSSLQIKHKYSHYNNLGPHQSTILQPSVPIPITESQHQQHSYSLPNPTRENHSIWIFSSQHPSTEISPSESLVSFPSTSKYLPDSSEINKMIIVTTKGEEYYKINLS